MYLIGPFEVSKLGSEIVNLLVKGSNIVTTDGVLEGIGGASAVENDSRNNLDNKLADSIHTNHLQAIKSDYSVV